MLNNTYLLNLELQTIRTVARVRRGKEKAIKSIIISVILNTIIMSSKDLETLNWLFIPDQNTHQKTSTTTSDPINVIISQGNDLKKVEKEAELLRLNLHKDLNYQPILGLII